MKGKRRIIITVCVLLVMTISIIGSWYGFGGAKAVKNLDDIDHVIEYSQSHLVAMLRSALEEPAQPDVAPLRASRGTLEGENLAFSPELSVGETYAPMVEEQLAGKVLLDSFVEEDGCLVYVAFDLEALDLVMVAVNPLV